MEKVTNPPLFCTSAEFDNTMTDFLSDALLDDLIYLTDAFGINLKVCRTTGCFQGYVFPALALYENETDSVLFTVSGERNLFLYYRKQFYTYSRGIIQKLMNSEKDTRREQTSLIDTIKKDV